MPFKSKAQEAWMYANHPEMAKEWASHTDQKILPERVKKKKAQASKKKPRPSGMGMYGTRGEPK